jgi:hypothetical protein
MFIEGSIIEPSLGVDPAITGEPAGGTERELSVEPVGCGPYSRRKRLTLAVGAPASGVVPRRLRELSPIFVPDA